MQRHLSAGALGQDGVTSGGLITTRRLESVAAVVVCVKRRAEMVETAPALNLRVQHSPNSWLTTPDSTMLNCLLYSRTGVSLCSFTDRTRSVSGFHFFSYSATGQCWKLYFAMAAATQNARRKSVIDSANSCIVIIFIYINFCRTQQQLCLNSVKIYFGERPLEPSGVISVNHWGISVYVTYCFWSSNTVSKIRFTGKKLKFRILGAP